jgi:hypothetical protein
MIQGESVEPLTFLCFTGASASHLKNTNPNLHRYLVQRLPTCIQRQLCTQFLCSSWGGDSQPWQPGTGTPNVDQIFALLPGRGVNATVTK